MRRLLVSSVATILAAAFIVVPGSRVTASVPARSFELFGTVDMVFRAIDGPLAAVTRQFLLTDFIEPPSARMQPVIDANGGAAPIRSTPATRYVSGRSTVDREEVLRDGAAVRVFGRVVQTEGGSMLVADWVWAPDNLHSAVIVTTWVTAVLAPTSVDPGPRSRGRVWVAHFEGPSHGPNFYPGTFSADLATIPTASGHEITGEWSLVSCCSHNRLRGRIIGALAPDGALEADLEVTGGHGQFYTDPTRRAIVGGGTLTGSGNSDGIRLQALHGRIHVKVIPSISPYSISLP